MVNRETYLGIIEKYFKAAQSEFERQSLQKIHMYCDLTVPFTHEKIMQYIGEHVPQKLGGVYTQTAKTVTKLKDELRQLNRKEKRKAKDSGKLA